MYGIYHITSYYVNESPFNKKLFFIEIEMLAIKGKYPEKIAFVNVFRTKKLHSLQVLIYIFISKYFISCAYILIYIIFWELLKLK